MRQCGSFLVKYFIGYLLHRQAVLHLELGVLAIARTVQRLTR